MGDVRMIRRWEVVDVDLQRGDVLGGHGRFFTRRGADRWRRLLNCFVRTRSRFELQVRRRDEAA